MNSEELFGNGLVVVKHVCFPLVGFVFGNLCQKIPILGIMTCVFPTLGLTHLVGPPVRAGAPFNSSIRFTAAVGNPIHSSKFTLSQVHVSHAGHTTIVRSLLPMLFLIPSIPRCRHRCHCGTRFRWISLEQGSLGRPRGLAWHSAAPCGLASTNCNRNRNRNSWGRRQHRQRRQRRQQSQRQSGPAFGRVGEAPLYP